MYSILIEQTCVVHTFVLEPVLTRSNENVIDVAIVQLETCLSVSRCLY